MKDSSKIHLPLPVSASALASQPIQGTLLQEPRQQKLSADLQLNVSKTDFQWKILVGRMSFSTINRLHQKFQTEVCCAYLVLCTLLLDFMPIPGLFLLYLTRIILIQSKKTIKQNLLSLCHVCVGSCTALYCMQNSEFVQIKRIQAHRQVKSSHFPA